VPEGTPGGLRVELSDELRNRQFTAPGLEKIAVAERARSGYSVTAYVELDRRGFVQHLLLEQPSGMTPVDAAVIRSLRAGSGVPGTGLATGRVKLYYWNRDRSEKE